MDPYEDFDSVEFWEDLSQYSLGEYERLKDKSKTAKIIGADSEKSSTQKSINALRHSRFVKERQVRVDEQEKVRNEIRKTVSKMKSKLDSTVNYKKSINSEFLYEIQNKSKDFQIIFEYLIDNEVLITQHRIATRKKKVKSPEKISPGLDKAVLKKELNLVKTKIYALKKAMNVFSEDSEQNKIRAREAEQVLNDLRLKKEAEDSMKPVEIIEPEPDSSADFEEFQRKISQQKANLLQELRDLELKCENGKETIENLQLELKNAKKIIQNPVLRTQVYSKLKDYIEDIEKDEKCSLSSTNIVYKNRRRVYSNKANMNLSINLNASKPATAPTVSNFKFYGLKPKLNTCKTHNKSVFSPSNETTKPHVSHKNLINNY